MDRFEWEDSRGQDDDEIVLFSVEQVAEFLGVHRETVRREIRRGNLHAIKVTHLLRISRKSLKEYLRSRQWVS